MEPCDKQSERLPDCGPTSSVSNWKVRDTDNFLFEIDEHVVEGHHLYFAHFAFKNFNKTALVQALKEWQVLRTIITVPLWAYATNDDEKWERFITLFGFKPTDVYLENEHGEPRQIFLSVVNG